MLNDYLRLLVKRPTTAYELRVSGKKIYPFIIAFRKACTGSDLPKGSSKNMNRFTPMARKVAGCFSFDISRPPAPP